MVSLCLKPHKLTTGNCTVSPYLKQINLRYLKLSVVSSTAGCIFSSCLTES